jgi:3',5'-cyclic-nucleotide phosphodiesterase
MVPMLRRTKIAILQYIAIFPILSNIALAHSRPPAPAFELVALGVLGGGDEANLTSYLLGRPGETPAVMIDGGSPVPGIIRWKEHNHELSPSATWSERNAAVASVMRPVHTLLLTHAHLDHTVGFALHTPLEADYPRAFPIDVVGLPETIDALRTHLYAPPLWSDFSHKPADHPVLRFVPIAAGGEYEAGTMHVRVLPLIHAIPSAAFLVTSGADAYLHLGDTGPSSAVWEAARPYLTAGHLRAIAVEQSFPSTRDADATVTGHLTPHLLIAELAKLAGCEPTVAAVVSHLRGVHIVAIHIKAADYDKVVAELHELRRAGLEIIIPEQGEAYRF